MEKLKKLFSGESSEEEETKKYVEQLRELLTHDCNRGKKEGCHELGEFYQVVEQNVEEAKNIFKTNCEERNHAHSCFSLGYLFFTAKEKDIVKALKYFERGCNGDSIGSCNNAGMIYQSGHEKSNIKMDMDKAIGNFDKACTGGHRLGCFNLSCIYLTGKNGAKKDLPRAFELSLKACELGHPWACANVSRMYKMGDGVEKDLEKSSEFRKRAQELKDNSRA
ncbi:cytochrome c oxidase assembly factor 7-like [Rhopilema esculentum]|eukprot:gene4652-20933_t